MERAENPESRGCPQRDSAEHEEYAGARSTGVQEDGERGDASYLPARRATR